MSQQVLVPILQRLLQHYLDVSDPSVDLLRGQLSLKEVALRPSGVGGVAVAGQVARVSAKWSWAQLFSQPLHVELTGLHLRLAPGAPTAPALEGSARGTLERLKRRLVDQLQVTVSDLVVDLGTAGLRLEGLRVAPAGATGHQAVALENLSVSVEGEDVVKGLAPRCTALRRKGRRFVDWKGLSIDLELMDAQIAFTRKQLLSLSGLLNEYITAEEEFFDCEDGTEMSAKPSWSRWLASWWTSDVEPEPEAEDDLGDELRIELKLGVELHAIDSSLRCQLGGHSSFVARELDRWNLTVELQQLSLSEQLSGRRLGGLRGERLVATTDSEQALSLEGSAELWITPEIVRSGLWLCSSCGSSAGAGSQWRVDWTVDLAVHVDQPWHERQLVLDLSSTGSCHSELTGQLEARLLLDDREILERLHLDLASKRQHCLVARDLRGRCEVGDLVAVTRMLRSILNELPAVTEGSGAGQELILSLGEVSWSLEDPLMELRTELSACGCCVKWWQGCWAVSAQSMGVEVHLAEVNCGLLQLTEPLIELKQSSLELSGQLRMLDPLQLEEALRVDSIWCSMSTTMGSKDIEVRCPQVRLNGREEFLLRWKLVSDFCLDFATALLLNPLLESSDFRIEDDLLVAEGSVFSGCRVRGREGHLLLLEERPQRCRFKATTAATALCATVSLEQRQGVKLAVEEAKIQFQEQALELEGTWTELSEGLWQQYKEQLTKALPTLFCHLSVSGRSLLTAAASSTCSSLAMLRYGGVATGAAAGAVAEGLVEAAKASVRKGKELRQAESYQFGDGVRGMLELSRDGGAGRAASFAAAAVPSTLGATLGGAALAPLGPAGVGAGMAAGGAVARRASEVAEGYRFGDVTRGVLKAGREARGAESGYQFGDFTKGVWSKFKK